FHAVTGRDFIDVPQMPEVPYVCLRVPTGGGKTLIAAHAVGTVAKRLGHQDRPLCLWVTPSTTIRDQTLRGLRDRNHAYHAALKETLGVPLMGLAFLFLPIANVDDDSDGLIESVSLAFL